MFFIAEFEDGLQLVPDCWVTPDKSLCFWPRHVPNQYKLNKIISMRTEPDDSWDIVPIKRIYGEADSYVKGVQKLKLCQKTSDIESGSDNGKKKRKRLFKKLLSSSESEEEKENSQSLIGNFPVVPKKMKSVQDDTSPLRFSSLEPTSNLQTSTNDEILQSATLHQVEYSIPANTCCCAKLEENTKILEKLLQKVNMIMYKVNCLEEKMERVKENEKDEDIKTTLKNFPFSTIEEFIKFDQTLIDEQLYKNLVKTFNYIGGSSARHVVSNIMKCAISNSVAEMYSWAGIKQKRTFKNFKFVQGILETIRLMFPQTTQEEVGTLIANWLRHAKQRRKREGLAANKDLSI